jgi:hypothetical protein
LKNPEASDVFSAPEVARVAGVRPRDVRNLVRSGVVRSIDGRFFTAREAVAAIRMLAGTTPADRVLFRPAPAIQREPGMPIAVSSGVHVATLAALAFATMFGTAKPLARVPHAGSRRRRWRRRHEAAGASSTRRTERRERAAQPGAKTEAARARRSAAHAARRSAAASA